MPSSVQTRKRATLSGTTVPSTSSSPSAKRQRKHLAEPPSAVVSTPLPDPDLLKESGSSSAMQETPVMETGEQDSDLEDGDRVLTRGWPRNYHHLERHGLAPVWTHNEGYPHSEIPEEIMRWLDEEGNSSLQMIGPLRSMAWLAGLDSLVDAIDSSAYTITDRIEILPRGANLLWVFEWHIEQGTIAEDMADRVLARQMNHRTSIPFESALTARTHTVNLAGVSESPSSLPLNSLVASSRLGGDSRHVLSMKASWGKGNDPIRALTANIRKQAGEHLTLGQLWFRGLSLYALELTLAFFAPAITASNRDNEFGPGMYTTDSLEYCLEYLRGGGAIMVFKSPNLREQIVWEPSLADWTSLVSKWTGMPLATANKPTPQYMSADFIKGPISSKKQPARRNLTPKQSDETQLVATSYRGLQALADSLSMIIFIDQT